jgi:hypothetical protein
MAKATDVVQTRRVEVVDELGRVRLVLGTLDPDSDMVGISIRDGNGSERAFMVSDSTGCEAGLVVGGNNIAGIRVGDDGGAAVFLADPRGALIQMWNNEAA